MSYQIANLEKELNVELFERSRKGLKLTPAGKAFYRSASIIVEQLETATMEARDAAAHDEGGGPLRIGFLGPTEQHFLPRAVNEYAAAHPNVNVVLRQVQPDKSFRMLENGDLDIVFSMRSHGDTFAMDDVFDVEKIDTLPLYAILWQGHPLASAGKLTRKDFENEQLVFIKQDLCPEIYASFVSEFERSGITVTHVEESSTMDGIAFFILAHKGVTILPYIYSGFDPSLVAVQMDGEREFVELVAVRVPSSISGKTEEFISCVKRALQEKAL